MMKQIQDEQNSFHSSSISKNFYSQALIQETITNRQHRQHRKILIALVFDMRTPDTTRI